MGGGETGALIPNFKGKVLNPHVHHWESRFQKDFAQRSVVSTSVSWASVREKARELQCTMRMCSTVFLWLVWRQHCHYPYPVTSISPSAHVHFHSLLSCVSSGCRKHRLATIELKRSSSVLFFTSFIHLLNQGKTHIHNIKYIYLVVQASPPSLSRTLPIIPNWNSVPIKQLPIPALSNP